MIRFQFRVHNVKLQNIITFRSNHISSTRLDLAHKPDTRHTHIHPDMYSTTPKLLIYHMHVCTLHLPVFGRPHCTNRSVTDYNTRTHTLSRNDTMFGENASTTFLRYNDDDDNDRMKLPLD